MVKRLFIALVVCGVLVFTTSPGVLAQDTDPANGVKSFLTAKGYTVGEVDNIPDEQGNPRPDQAYVLMDAVTGDLDSQDLETQVVWGFVALRQYYPRVVTLSTVLEYKQFWIFFRSSDKDLDRFLKKTISGTAYWNSVRSQVRIYDRVTLSFVDEKTFTSNDQTGKDQIGKDFGKNPPNPVPTPVPGNAKGGTLWLEPSTTYLPADGKSSAVVMVTLLDSNYAPLSNRAVNFEYEAAGEDAQNVGTQNTNASGIARASVKGSPDWDSLLLRASTETLNSQASIVVGPAVTAKADQIQAVEQGLTKQGYDDVQVDYDSRTRATGEVVNSGEADMRIASQTFDRSVYSQMSRAFGTLRTVFPKVNQLYVGLVYRKDGRDWYLYWAAQVAYWDQLVSGKISEGDFWRYLQYLGAFDENGNSADEKNFLDKNFGAGTGGKEARVTHTLESTVTKETWGDQWHGQEFVILPGSYADTFTVSEMSGSATAIQIFQAPDFATPLVTYKQGDSPDGLKKVRLGQGQYLFAVAASSAPAAARATFVEHLPQ